MRPLSTKGCAHPIYSTIPFISIDCRTPATEAVAISPTSAQATIFPNAGISGPYTVTATPVGGGSPVTVTCATPDCQLTGLAPGTTYTVAVSGITTATGLPTPPSPSATIITPAAGAPALSVAVTGSGSINVDISPAAGVTGPYTLVASPLGGGAPITVTCSVPADCILTGLAPGTTYKVTSTATDAFGQPTPASAPVVITTPVAG